MTKLKKWSRYNLFHLYSCNGCGFIYAICRGRKGSKRSGRVNYRVKSTKHFIVGLARCYRLF